jgi:hypothetical protein
VGRAEADANGWVRVGSLSPGVFFETDAGLFCVKIAYRSDTRGLCVVLGSGELTDLAPGGYETPGREIDVNAAYAALAALEAEVGLLRGIFSQDFCADNRTAEVARLQGRLEGRAEAFAEMLRDLGGGKTLDFQVGWARLKAEEVRRAVASRGREVFGV